MTSKALAQSISAFCLELAVQCYDCSVRYGAVGIGSLYSKKKLDVLLVDPLKKTVAGEPATVKIILVNFFKLHRLLRLS